MQKQIGKPKPRISSSDAEAVNESDKANPGALTTIKAEQRQQQKGKYGTVATTPYKPAAEDKALEQTAKQKSGDEKSEKGQDEKPSWIEIELVGEDNLPIAGEPYRVTLPDGTVDQGTLDQNGQVRIEGFKAGNCQITFPELDAAVWDEI